MSVPNLNPNAQRPVRTHHHKVFDDGLTGFEKFLYNFVGARSIFAPVLESGNETEGQMDPPVEYNFLTLDQVKEFVCKPGDKKGVLYVRRKGERAVAVGLPELRLRFSRVKNEYGEFNIHQQKTKDGMYTKYWFESKDGSKVSSFGWVFGAYPDTNMVPAVVEENVNDSTGTDD